MLHMTPHHVTHSLSHPHPPTAQVSGTYERCCALFNIGALQSQIAKSQNFENDDGLKTAAKHFQASHRHAGRQTAGRLVVLPVTKHIPS